MPRPRKEPPSPSRLVPAIVRYARSRAVDVDVLVCRFGFSADVEERDDELVGPETPNDLLEAVGHACGEPDIAFRLGLALPTRRYGFAELAVRASPTVRDAVVRLARYAPLLHGSFEASLEEAGDEASFVLRTPRSPRGIGRFVHELALAHILTQCREGAAAAFPVSRVWFSHARPPDLEAVRTFFGARAIDFGTTDSGLAFERARLDTPMKARDERLLATIEPLADAALAASALVAPPASLAGRAAARLAATLPAGTDIADVAAALHMSARTLQRRLEEEGTRFSDVLDRVRLDVARCALADSRATLSDVASRLGFGDLTTFSRAFKRWTGKPPGQWRRSRG